MPLEAILQPPRFVAYDAGTGEPLVGGQVRTLIPGTSTGKLSWADAQGLLPNPNPITLDSSGSATIYGSGDYALAVTDRDGNLIAGYSGVTRGTPVSDAMLPVLAAATLAAARAALGADPLTDAIQQAATGHFFASEGAVVNRINDRLLIGAATAQDGNAGPGGVRSWLGQAAGGVDQYFDTTSQLEVAQTTGNVAGAFGARSSTITGASKGAFGITTFGLNDITTADGQAWGIYSSAVRASAHGVYTAGIESDVTTLQPYVRVSAYNTVPAGVTTAYTAAAGGETALREAGADSGLVVNPTSAAMLIFTAGGTGVNEANPIAGTGAIFGKGIVFQNNAIIGTDGSSGSWGTAIEMVKGQAIVWANDGAAATSIGGMIRSDNVSGQSAGQARVVFGPTGLLVKGVEADLIHENTSLSVQSVPLSVNFPVIAPSITGGQAIYGAGGTDANIDVRLLPKGSGLVWLSSSGASGASVAANFHANNYLAVRDGTGAIYYLPLMSAPW
jgi:hypothetical protein